MKLFSSCNEFRSKLNIIYDPEYFDIINENYVDTIILTKHAIERSAERDKRILNIPKSDVDKIVYSAEKPILNYKKTVHKPVFIVFDRRLQLNVVGALQPNKDKDGFDFVVITLMYKDEYELKNPATDKKIYTKTEAKPHRRQIEDNNEHIIYVVDDIMYV
jgi:hypothetical protein